MSKPLRLIHCAIDTGGGGGIARMDTYHHRYLNRDLFDPEFVLARHEIPDEVPYDPSMRYVYTGRENRFGRLLEIFQSADIVQFAGGFDPMTCEAARAAGVPVLAETMHMVEPGLLFDYIDVSICVSHAVQRVQPHPEKTVVIHNGIDLDDFPFNDNPGNGGKIVLLESTRRKKKMHFHLDELAGDLLPLSDGIEIWLAGRGQVGESSDRVRYLGLRDDIAELYRKADILALFSKEEPFGLVVLEAMASGCLPIVADDGGMAEIVTHGVDGWLAPGGDDRAAVIATIKEAVSLHGSNRWETMRRAARKTVVTRFSAEVCVRGYEKVYLGLIEKKGRRTRPGPLNVPQTPEANVGDALFHFNNNLWDEVKAALARLNEQPAPVTAAACAEVLKLLAIHAVANRHEDIARLCYRKLYHSGFTDTESFRRWLDVLGDNSESAAVLAGLMRREPDNPEWVLRAAERALNAGDVTGALEILKTGSERIQDSEELRNVLDTLRNRLGENP